MDSTPFCLNYKGMGKAKHTGSSAKELVTMGTGKERRASPGGKFAHKHMGLVFSYVVAVLNQLETH